MESILFLLQRHTFLKYYIWRNIEVGSLCFSAKSLLANPRIIVCKSINNVKLRQSIFSRDVSACI